MAKKVFLAGVGVLELFNGKDKVVTSKTLLNSSIAIGVSAEEVRAGQGAGLIGRYFHSSTFEMTAEDALFSMEYISLNVGSDIMIGGDTLVTEQLEVDSQNKVTVKGTPVDFAGQGTVGWYTIAGEENWKPITFAEKEATLSGVAQGTKVCVQYNAVNDALRQIIVPANIVPSECRALLTANLYAGESFDLTTSSKVGKVVVEIPRFQLSGTQDLAMNMTGASTSSLSGSALISYEGASCDGEGFYAKIKEVVVGASMYDGVIDIAVQGTGFKENDYVITRAIYANALPKVIPPKDLKYSGGTWNVDATGKITAKDASNPCIVTIKAADASDDVKALKAVFTAGA